MSRSPDTLIRALVVLLAASLAGCNRSTPEADLAPIESSSTDRGNAPSDASPATAAAIGNVTSPRSGGSPAVIIAGSGEPSRIGPGHFHGSRELMVSRAPVIRLLTMSPDGRFAVVARRLNHFSGSLQIRDVTTGRLLNEVVEPNGVTAVAFAPDSQTLFYGAGDHTIVQQPLPAGNAARWSGHHLMIHDLQLSPDGRFLVSAGIDRRLVVWDVALGAIVAEAVAGGTRGISRTGFLSAGRLWTITDGDTLQSWDMQPPSLVPGVTVKLTAGLWSPVADGQTLYGLQSDRSLRIVDAVTGEEFAAQFSAPAGPNGTSEARPVETPRPVRNITAMTVAPASHEFAACTTDGRLTLWSQGQPAAKQSWELKAGVVISLATDHHGRQWIAQTAGGGLVTFDREHPESLLWIERENRALRGPAPARFGPEGDTVVSLRDETTVTLSQIGTGLPLRHMAVPDANEVTALLAGRDGIVFAGSSTGRVDAWKAGSTEPLALAKTMTAITALAGSPEGRQLLACGADGSVTWLDPLQTFPPIRRQEHSARVGAVAISPDGLWAATAGVDQTIVLWNAAKQSRAMTLKDHQTAVLAVTFSPDSQWLISGDQRGIVTAWSVPAGKPAWSITLNSALMRRPGGVASALIEAAWSAAEALKSELEVPGTSDGPTPRPGDVERTKAAEPTASTESVETDSTAGREAAGTQRVVAPSSPVIENRLSAGISALAVSSGQRVLAVGTEAGYVQTFDLNSRRELSSTFHGASISDLAFADEDRSLLVATTAGEVSRWWQAPDNPRMLPGHEGSVKFAALDASGRRAVTGGIDKRLCVWDVDQNKLLQALDNEGEAVVSGALSPDGQRAVSGGYGSGVVFWDLSAPQRIGKRYGHGKRILAFAFSADGRLVASGSDDQTVRIWDFASQKSRKTIQHDAAVHFVAFSPDGTNLITSTLDPRGWQFPARLRLWETATGQPLVEFSGHRVTVNAAVFSADGRELTSCDADGQTCRWEISSGRLIRQWSRPDGLSHAGLLNDGRMLVMRRFNKGVIIHDTQSMARLAEFDVPTRSVGTLHVSPGGKRIIAGTDEGAVYIWDIGHE